MYLHSSRLIVFNSDCNMRISRKLKKKKKKKKTLIFRSTPDQPRASPMAQWLKNSPAMQEPGKTQVRSLSQEDPLKKDMATHSSILAWRIPWAEEPGSPQGRKELDMTEVNEHTRMSD